MTVSVDVQLIIIDRSGGQANRHSPVYQRSAYDETYETRIALTANVKRDVKVPFDTIQLVFIDADDNTVRVYQGLSPEYWQVTHAFLAFNCSITQLHLMATEDCTVTIFVGGT